MSESEKFRELLESLSKYDAAMQPFVYGKLLQSIFTCNTDRMDKLVYMLFDMSTLLIDRITNNCEKYWGYDKAEMEGMDIRKLIHKEDLEESIKLADLSMLGTEPIFGYRNKHIAKDGAILHLLWDAFQTINNKCFCSIRILKVVKP